MKQQAGNIKGSVWDQVGKRFGEETVPVKKNAVDNREVDQVLIPLGKADHAFDSLVVLGKHASKFKRAKDVFTTAVPNLNPTDARNVVAAMSLERVA